MHLQLRTDWEVWSDHEWEAGPLLWAPGDPVLQLQEDEPAVHYGSPTCEDQPASAAKRRVATVNQEAFKGVTTLS